MNNDFAQRAVTIIHAAAASSKASDHHKYPASACPPLMPFLLSHTLTMAHTLATPENEPKNDNKLLPTSTPNDQTNRLFMPRPKQQQEHQRAYVLALVDVTVHAIGTIWPNTSNAPMQGSRHVAHLDQFLQHILRQSRTTHSALQLAIFYLFRIRPRVTERRHNNAYIACGRRMFLAALICAHKFLQDKTYSNLAWSKVSGLPVAEVNHAERIMLQLLDWSLFVKKDTYDEWLKMLQSHLKCHIPSQPIDCAKNKEQEQEQEQQQQQQQPEFIPIMSVPSNIAANKKILNMSGMPTPPVDNGCIHPIPALVLDRSCGHGPLPSPPEEHQLHQEEEQQRPKRKLLEDGGGDIRRQRRPRHVV